jgi:hypothetical protein
MDQTGGNDQTGDVSDAVCATRTVEFCWSFVYCGDEPTNQVIQTFNFIDSRGYKITKK